MPEKYKVFITFDKVAEFQNLPDALDFVINKIFEDDKLKENMKNSYVEIYKVKKFGELVFRANYEVLERLRIK